MNGIFSPSSAHLAPLASFAPGLRKKLLKRELLPAHVSAIQRLLGRRSQIPPHADPGLKNVAFSEDVQKIAEERLPSADGKLQEFLEEVAGARDGVTGSLDSDITSVES